MAHGRRMDIEKVRGNPELILKEAIDPSVGLRGFQAAKLPLVGIPNDLITPRRSSAHVVRSYEKWTLLCA